MIERIRFWYCRIVLFCASVLVPVVASAQPATLWSQEAGRTVTQNFGPRDYQAHVQNWAIVQDARGLMYFGNGDGVLEYDGDSWRLIETTGRTSVRSLAVGPDERVYVGAHGDFGYLAPDSSGTLAYVSLQSRLPAGDHAFTEVWRVVSAGDGIYFSSRERLFRLSPQGAVDVWKPSSIFALGFVFRDAFHTVVPGEGLMRMEGEEPVLAPAGDAFSDDIIYFTLPQDDGTVLLGTRDHGLLRYDGASLRPFITDVDARLRRDMLYHGAVLKDGTLALATRRGGLYLVSQTGDLLRVLDETSGLHDEQLWYAYADAGGSLWLALNAGLARVEMPAPLSFFKKEAGVRGVVMDITRQDEDLYAATAQGVFRLTTSAGTAPHFQPAQVEGSGQCLSLLATEAGLLAGCEGGIYAIDGTSSQKIDGRTTRLLYRSRQVPRRAYASTREGLVRLVLERGAWRTDGLIDGLPAWALSIREDRQGALWATTTSDGVFRGATSDTGTSAVVHFDTTDGLPAGWSYAAPVSGDLLFHTVEGVYRFDESRRHFVPDTVFGAWLPDPDGEVFRLEQDGRGDVWFVNDTDVGVARRQKDGTFDVEQNALGRLSEHYVVTIYPEESGQTWIGTSDGIYRFDAAATDTGPRESSVQIRRVAARNGDSLVYGGAGDHPGQVRVAHAHSGLRFTFALPDYEAEAAARYQVRLDGLDQGWSGWSAATEKEYTSLPAGDYVFRVRGRDADGRIRDEDTFSFSVLPPWHQTWWAQLLAVVGLMGFVLALAYGAARYRGRRLSERNARLEEEVAQRTETLVRTNERLQRALDQNSEFMSIAAHDLKNPVTSIIGFSDILLDEGVSESEAREFLSIIRQSADRMHVVLHELQDADALETGHIDLQLVRGDVVAAADSALVRNGARADAKSIRLHLERERSVDALFDEQYLPRILDNLISNAIKFSPRGSDVWVRLRSEPRRAVVEVVDEGPGLTADDRARVFGKRAQLSARPTDGETSSGLGLYIVRMLVELHGGHIYVESEPGEGAVFGFTLPRYQAHQDGDGAPGGAAAMHMRPGIEPTSRR